jgi:penicillin-binding protein 1A
MVQGGLMTEGQVVAARRNPASVVDRGSREAPDYFLDWAFEEVQRIAGRFPRYPLIVRTTIDMGLQTAGEEALEFGLRQNGASFRVSQGAVVLMEHGGAIRAMVGGRDYGESQFNRATKALRQPGSSFKGFVYATAMENGFTPQSIVSDGPITWNGWSPRNYTRGFAGRVDLTSALARSLNTVPVRLARDHLGTEAIAETARRFGVQTPVRTDKTMPLGTSEITVLDMATGYGVFPAGGYETNRHGITQILNHRGDVLYDHARDNPAPQRVLSEQADIYMNTMLAQIPEWGTARRAKLDGIRTAGKTGTSQSYRDAWFIGYTGNYTAAVWFGNDDFTPMNNMTDVQALNGLRASGHRIAGDPGRRARSAVGNRTGRGRGRRGRRPDAAPAPPGAVEGKHRLAARHCRQFCQCHGLHATRRTRCRSGHSGVRESVGAWLAFEWHTCQA